MLKLYFLLFIEFLQIGFFAVGGGYAALPFLFELQQKYSWFTVDELTDMIAVANITPGPVGINSATYVGFKTAGITGALIATTSIVLIPFIIAVLISKAFEKFKRLEIVHDIFLGLRPAACALLVSVAFKLMCNTFKISLTPESALDIKSIILFVLLIIPFWFFKKNPFAAILAGAVGGILIKSI